MNEADEAAGLVIRKETVPVEICTEQGAPVRGEVFLRPQEGNEPGERLLDVLAQRAFVPVKTPERLVFIAVRHMAFMRLDLLAAVDELDADAENDEHGGVAHVIVELWGGGRLEGRIRYAMRTPSWRVSDYLEHLPAFFPLTTDDFLYLVSSTRVVNVTVLEERR